MININNIANIITFLRIICSFLLIFSKTYSELFWVIYVYCGVSDVLDGYIARLTKSNSDFGAKIDSISDLFFIVALTISFSSELLFTLSIYFFIGVIILVKCINYLLGYIKYNTFYALHTYLNKLTGVYIFFIPALFLFINIYIVELVLCILASCAVIEELVINIKAKEVDRDCKSILELYSSSL